MTVLAEGLDYLDAQNFASLLAMFWFVAVFEIPRYMLAFAVVALVPPRRAQAPFEGRISAIVAGHSEAGAIERCVACLREQSRPPDEIVVVSDGSADRTAEVMRDLLHRGLVDIAHATELRGGKSAAVNLAARWCTGDVIVNVDCDCSFDRHAIARLVRPLSDPAVDAVSGNVAVRNAGASLTATCQALEYLVTISLGKQAGDRLDQVTCVSGAFGAFRRQRFLALGGLDAGGGEDLDLTLTVRRAGGAVRFAEDAICYTDVPATPARLIHQRFRWERDAVHLRYRKHAALLDPFSRHFRWQELLHEAEFLLFNVIAAAALPFYVLWLFLTYGAFAPSVLVAGQAGVMLLDLITVLLAMGLSPSNQTPRYLAYVPAFSLYNGVFMRFVRLAAYVQEWVFHASYGDPYVPDKVHRRRG